jgi:hypothetical protein
VQDAQMQVGLMRTLDVWLAEDHSRVENRLCQREAVGQLVEVYSRLCRNMASVRSPVMPQMLESLKVMLDRCVLCRAVIRPVVLWRMLWHAVIC